MTLYRLPFPEDRSPKDSTHPAERHGRCKNSLDSTNMLRSDSPEAHCTFTLPTNIQKDESVIFSISDLARLRDVCSSRHTRLISDTCRLRRSYTGERNTGCHVVTTESDEYKTRWPGQVYSPKTARLFPVRAPLNLRIRQSSRGVSRNPPILRSRPSRPFALTRATICSPLDAASFHVLPYR